MGGHVEESILYLHFDHFTGEAKQHIKPIQMP